MLIHGEEDSRVPIAHAKAIRIAFERTGKDIRWLKFGRASHGIWGFKNKVKYYTELLDFFNSNLKQKPRVAKKMSKHTKL